MVYMCLLKEFNLPFPFPCRDSTAAWPDESDGPWWDECPDDKTKLLRKRRPGKDRLTMET